MAVKWTGTSESVQNNGFLAGNAGPWTIMGWFKLVSTAATSKYVFESMGSSSNDTNQLALIFGFVAGEYELFSSSAAGVRTSSAITPGDTNWHHIAWRKQASGTSAYDKFLDGTKTSINASIAFTMPTPMAYATLAGAKSSAAEIDISIYRFFILEQALSDADITAEVAGTYSGPTYGVNDAYWSFASTAGTDNSGNGRDWGGAVGTTLVTNPSVFSSALAAAMIPSYRRRRIQCF